MQRGISALSGLGAGSRREFYIHKRKNGIFYVEFINPENGKKLSARSTGETVRSKAEAKAEFQYYSPSIRIAVVFPFEAWSLLG